jgi:uncharacterized membrane protein YbhN (UPF0104 family)
MVGLLAMGAYSLFVSGIAATGPLFAGGVAALTGITALILAGAAWPTGLRVALATLSRALCRLSGQEARLRPWRPRHGDPGGPAVDRMDPLTGRLVDLVYGYREDVRRFIAAGKATFVAVSLLSLVFLLARAVMPFLCARFLGLEGPTLRHVVDAQVALIFLVFFAPTPGGAAIAEGASLAIMADAVPAGYAPYYNLLWRTTTAYLPALAGFACLASALVRDARRLVRRPSEPAPVNPVPVEERTR